MLPERYRLEGGIAAGGMAAVYAAHDTVLNRSVAVKVLADHLNDDVTARARFEREARAAASLSSHPGVVTIFDVGEHEGRAFLVMELREGGTLADVGQVSPERALGWLHTVADALDTAHAAGVVHRDIKPRNLLLDEQDRVAVADFGIATVAEETERFTQTGQVLGTASYLSPEQALGEPATAASDRYALAVLAYELLTGAKPFTASHFAAQARAHIEDPPPPAPGLPRAAQRVLDRGLAKDPADRWPSATAFVDALEAALAGDETEATRAMPPQPRAAATPPPPRPRPRTAAAPPTPPRAGRRGVFAAVAVAMALAAIAVAALTAGGDDGGRTTAETPEATAKPEKTAKPKKTATTAPEPEPTASPSPEPEPEETTAPATAGDPSALNNEGFALYQSGDYEAAIEPLEGAVAACGDSSDLDPCGYAIYNLGSALHRAGRSDEAIPLLERRLAGWSYKRGVVKKELEAAQAAAGDDGR